MSWDEILSILAMTAGHTFWLFYLSGAIPGTVERRPDVDTEEKSK